ncbi:hypothetical protein N5079_28450 [Planotetraspora sp. A-T 1434]|uniref:hypothetical protein n=1 Tax=Planotetraspora sp. A-T 1434 TaxID=2979219 RepID=UPI0021BF7C0A|nr:hypothetical protein [Planotetraspora sp. A-T 1434]MCT9934142.1 hypothetical protein [Planotetraspora sp. A-T 1434]
MSGEKAASVPVLTVSSLREAFPGWSIWRSSAGRLWATRNCRLTNEDYNRGLCQTIDGDDVGQLAAELRRQAALASALPNSEARCLVSRDSSH